MSIAQYGYRLVVIGKPNAEGLCVHKLIDERGDEVAVIDQPCTAEDAIRAARKFVEEMEKDD